MDVVKQGPAAGLELFVSAPRGLEPLLAEELTALAADAVRPARGGVHCRGDLALVYRIGLWSRFGGRLLLPLCQGAAGDADQLYALARQVDWSAHFPVSATFAVDSHVQQSQLRHSQFVALKVKDAVVDSFRAATGQRPDVDSRTPCWRVNVHLYRDQLTLSLDLSGESLHRRGYRCEGGMAPLKEHLAAALLARAGWPAIAARGGAFVDPLCGSGTLVLEAALMAGDGAPGLLRSGFAFEHWCRHDPVLWQQLRAEARRRWQLGMAQVPPLLGFDQNANAVALARINAERAGLSEQVCFESLPLDQLGCRSLPQPAGLVLTNPPYGQRLGTVEQVAGLYRQLGVQLRQAAQGWKLAVLTGAPELGPQLGLRALRKHHFFNGALSCQLLHFVIEPQYYFREPVEASHGLAPVEQLSDGGQMFANRLRKNLRHLGRWARRRQISCYRLYDADLPDYAVAIDLYGEQVQVQEYQAPPECDPRLARRRLREVVTVLPEVLGVSADAVHVKVRQRQRGQAQYQRQDDSGRFFIVEEGGLKFEVNLQDYLDTGLFLDHRQTRELIRDKAAGRDMLNLFAYTGSATVYAAAGGARSTTSVDLSATYLRWARRNLQRNGFDGPAHRFIQADCLAWLAEEQRCYGLIFVDPPTFSNSKRMEGVFDVQRDHVELLTAAAARLDVAGELIFSTNLRRFRLDAAALTAAGLAWEDLGVATLPEDFRRNPRIHSCWRLWRV